MEFNISSATSSLIIKHLTLNSGRKRDAIKKQRQTATYEAIIEKLRAERAPVQEEKEDISTAETHASEVLQETLVLEMTQQNKIPAVTSPSALSLPAVNAETNVASASNGEADENNDNSALIAAIIGLNLDEHDDAVRQQILSSTADQPRELDEWTSVLIASLVKPNRPTKRHASNPQQTADGKNNRAGLYRKTQREYAVNPRTLAQKILESDNWEVDATATN
uniref:Uncharacterized protein n=1 Tax=Glossina pallidipes TaxID=7398 RepID=A0A1A9ZAW0_GLOPL